MSGDLGHRGELEGIVGLARLEEGARLVDRPVPPAYERDGDRLGEPQLPH